MAAHSSSGGGNGSGPPPQQHGAPPIDRDSEETLSFLGGDMADSVRSRGGAGQGGTGQHGEARLALACKTNLQAPAVVLTRIHHHKFV